MSTELLPLEVDFQGDLRRINVRLGGVQLKVVFEEIQSAVCEGFGLLGEKVSLKYVDEEGDLCTLTPLTIEDFLVRPMSCSEEFNTPFKLLLSCRGRTLERPSQWRARAHNSSGACKFKMSGDQNLSLDSPGRLTEPPTPAFTLLRSFGPVALLACLKGMYESRRLTPEILTSLMLQFLPIFAQRVQRKVEKMNRKGVKMRQDKSFKPFMQFLKRLCLHFQDISETRHVREDLLNYLNGSEVRLGDTLAELLRSLVSCNSRAALATALIAVAKDILRVLLPCIIPETKNQETGPCSSWAAAFLGAPVHEGVTCALCFQQPIIGPCFEGQAKDGLSLCGPCFVKETVKGKADESSYTCRLAPTGYDAERALGDANNPSLQIAALLAVGWHPLGSMQAIQADLQTNFGLVHL